MSRIGSWRRIYMKKFEGEKKSWREEQDKNLEDERDRLF